MTTEDKLRKLFAILVKAAQTDPKLLSEIEQLFDRPTPGGSVHDPVPYKGKSSSVRETEYGNDWTHNRRKAAPFDPYVVYQE